ncbi:hypothetical protein BWQ96_06315 [Gracilariopsis chorda]|uniref:Uncharacterized protein n=1 Tax=Gracilariopsis chorda TaxID=448386 RepID=A0A2V3IPD5_9FLOR|nr:hypothetical protein BWQ96_06315 [Gracilariopsis chorda]|eukprot:PXF43946.1 hypothetical protein BWQ96_06315 [Gracilariopsis chorda]
MDYLLYKISPAVGQTMKKLVCKDESRLQKRKDAGNSYESSVAQDNGEVTAAVFAPKMVRERALSATSAFLKSMTGVIVIGTAGNE